MGQGMYEEQQRPRPNPFCEVIIGLKGYYREHVKGKSGLTHNCFKIKDMWKKVRLIWTLLFAIRRT